MKEREGEISIINNRWISSICESLMLICRHAYYHLISRNSLAVEQEGLLYSIKCERSIKSCNPTVNYWLTPVHPTPSWCWKKLKGWRQIVNKWDVLYTSTNLQPAVRLHLSYSFIAILWLVSLLLVLKIIIAAAVVIAVAARDEVVIVAV